MKHLKFSTLLLVIIFAGCEEKLEEIGDPKNIIGNTETFTHTIYVDYDSLIQIDSAFVIEGNRSSFGGHHNSKMLFLMRFFDFFQNDSVISIDSARIRLINDYVIGEYPTTVPLKFYEFEQTWTADSLSNIMDLYPIGSRADAILNMTSGVPVFQQDYTFTEPDTGNNTRAENDTIYIDIDTEIIERWYNDEDWDLKGLLLYPDFSDYLMMSFYPYGSTGVTGIEISYTRVDDEGNSEAISDSLFIISTDVTFFDGDYPESIDPSYYNLSTGRFHKSFVNFDYGSLPDRAIVLQGRVIIPVDFGNSFYSIARPLKAIQMTPLIKDSDGQLIQPSFLRTYFIDDINSDHDTWKLQNPFTGPFGSEILQPVYNGIKVNPDSQFVKGYYLELLGSMDDYSFIKVNSASAPLEQRPKIEVVYFIPPAPRF